MKFQRTTIQGMFVVDLEPRSDDRGMFARAYCRREFEEQGIEFNVIQSNLAHTKYAGTVRGLHYQVEPAGEQKFARCVVGAVYDVTVDMRPESPTFRRTFAITLSAANRTSLFIPAGVAHGYQALEDGSDFFYMTDQGYEPSCERGVRFDDPLISIELPMPAILVSERDCRWPLLDKIF